MKLWLVRHALPLIDLGICYGATDVLPEAPATQAAAQALSHVLPQGLRLLTSPLQRCELLTQSLRTLRPDLTYQVEPRLAEMSFGCWEGQRWDAIPVPEFDRWNADFAQPRFGGAESVSEFMQRVAGVWDEFKTEGQDGVWLTHAGVIRAASLLAQGVRNITHADQWPKNAPAFGQWWQLEI